MAGEAIPETVKRFILTTVSSVPYLEAMLLLRAEPHGTWDAKRLARRLYVAEKAAEELLAELCAGGVLVTAEGPAPSYRYEPRSGELRDRIDEVAEAYSKNLVAITDLIHSETNRMAQHFADAFKWRKDE